MMRASLHNVLRRTTLNTSIRAPLVYETAILPSGTYVNISCVSPQGQGDAATHATHAAPRSSGSSGSRAHAFHTSSVTLTPSTQKVSSHRDSVDQESGKPVKRYQKVGGGDRFPDFVEEWTATRFKQVGVAGVLAFAGAGVVISPWFLTGLAPMAWYWKVGLADLNQKHHTVKRNFPFLANIRYVLESIRPEIQQYFIEDEDDEKPFSRERRSLIYARSKGSGDTLPFGTKRAVYDVGYEWINHSLYPEHPPAEAARVVFGGKLCSKPYSASLLNISAMSYGALSRNAIRALNEGAAFGNFAHNTGEGGLSPYHLEKGGDVIWQVGTGYFGCRTLDGDFNPEMFKKNAGHDQVKMIEIKLSQGAKPGHGGILPASKLTAEIAEIRGVKMGEDVLSPGAHTAFSSPAGLCEFIQQLRELSGGKPVGFKLCLGNPVEFMSLCRAMIETGITPDFITVDGGEGGTGAAPLEFSNSIGTPLLDGLAFVNNTLIGAGLRNEMRIIASGKVANGFTMTRLLAQGADTCNSARGFMFSLGCIQALKCNTNKCPTGIATQDEYLMNGLVVETKSARVARFHEKTVESCLELVGAAGLPSTEYLRPYHIFRRVSKTDVCTLEDIYPTMEYGQLLQCQKTDSHMARMWHVAGRPDIMAGSPLGQAAPATSTPQDL